MEEKKNKNYFTHDTELAIIKYVNTEDYAERNKIYREEIHYALFKLTQNLIHTFKFYYTEETNLEDLQHEVITFLLTKLDRFNPENGAKAYSYFGTIAKRYLIASNQKNYKKRMELLSLDNLNIEQEDGEYVHGDVLDINGTQADSQVYHPVDQVSEFLDLYVTYCTANIYELFPKDEDAQIADAILELFRKREHITIFNKKALYIYIREIIDIKTPRITKVASELGDLYKKHYAFYIENGYANF
jgi:DNA-directed RNA polymerase specialized sigma24 family protein